ncbi:MAG: MFS transporter [Actinobacteria bacterium]|nr:MFS transporter [Actinomycetota bacterium]
MTDPAAAVADAGVEQLPHWKRHTTFFLTGQFVSLLGSSLVQYAILWHLTLTTQSGLVLTLATAFGFLPQAVMAVFGGVWADRYNRKLLIIAADSTIAAVTLVLAVMLLRGEDSLWPVFAVLAIRSLGAGVQQPAVNALLPQIVPADRLIKVNGINTTLQSSLMLLAPAVAAALYAGLGIQAVLLVDVVTAVIGIALLLAVPVARLATTTAGEGYLADVRAGLSYVRAHPVVLRVLLLFAAVYFLCAPPAYLTPLMVARTFGSDVWLLTANEIAFGAGMLAGGAVVALTGGRHDRVRLVLLSSAAFGATTIGMGLSGAVFGWPGIFWLFLGFILVCGVSIAYFSTASTTLFQEQVEPEMMGRVFSLNSIIWSLGMPVGMLLFGPLSDVVSVEWLLIGTGLATLAATAIAAVGAPAAPAPEPERSTAPA